VKKQVTAPDAVVGRVLGATLPEDAIVARQALVVTARLDRAPADRLGIEVRDEAAGRARLRMTAISLLAQPIRAFPRQEMRPRTPAAAACTAGTGFWTPGRARRRPSAGLPSSPRWRTPPRSQGPLPSCQRFCRSSGPNRGARHDGDHYSRRAASLLSPHAIATTLLSPRALATSGARSDRQGPPILRRNPGDLPVRWVGNNGGMAAEYNDTDRYGGAPFTSPDPTGARFCEAGEHGHWQVRDLAVPKGR